MPYTDPATGTEYTHIRPGSAVMHLRWSKTRGINEVGDVYVQNDVDWYMTVELTNAANTVTHVVSFDGEASPGIADFSANDDYWLRWFYEGGGGPDVGFRPTVEACQLGAVFPVLRAHQLIDQDRVEFSMPSPVGGVSPCRKEFKRKATWVVG